MVWDLDRLTGRAGLRETLSVDLQSADAQTKISTLSALGVLWRLSGESDLPRLPTAQHLTLSLCDFEDPAEFDADLREASIFAVLETLSSRTVSVRRAGETWLRVNLASHVQ